MGRVRVVSQDHWNGTQWDGQEWSRVRWGLLAEESSQEALKALAHHREVCPVVRLWWRLLKGCGQSR